MKPSDKEVQAYVTQRIPVELQEPYADEVKRIAATYRGGYEAGFEAGQRAERRKAKQLKRVFTRLRMGNLRRK